MEIRSSGIRTCVMPEIDKAMEYEICQTEIQDAHEMDGDLEMATP